MRSRPRWPPYILGRNTTWTISTKKIIPSTFKLGKFVTFDLMY